MEISRELAARILKYLDTHKSWYFPFRVMGRAGEDGHVHTFFLQENLQHLDTDTTRLLAKGFVEKITGESLEEYIAGQAKVYRVYWQEGLWESEDVEVFGLNEFIGGKAEAYEDCLEMMRRLGV